MASKRTLKLRAAHEQAALAQVSPLVQPPDSAQQPPPAQKSLDGGELTERVVFELDDGRKAVRTLRAGRIVSERLLLPGEVA